MADDEQLADPVGVSDQPDRPIQNKKLLKVKRSELYKEIAQNQWPIVYHPIYNISFCGIERFHPFDSRKWGRVYAKLIELGLFDESQTVQPSEATTNDLRVVHTPVYLGSLHCPCRVAQVVEVAPLAFIPPCIIDRVLLKSLRYQTGGSILAARLALLRGWSINIGGGFHHASSSSGGGFCVYADITLALTFLFLNELITRAMIVDLDAHQGNGHENDFIGDDRVYILDMFNNHIYPRDNRAKCAISRSVHLHHGTQDAEYLESLQQNLENALNEFRTDIIVYNAGTDCLSGDPLGCLAISPLGIEKRDEIVFSMAKQKHIPIVMLLSGGYMRNTHEVIARSIINLCDKNIISNTI